MERSGGFCGIGQAIFATTIALLLCSPPVRASDTSTRLGTSGGTVTLDGNFVLGYDPSSTETYTLSAGTLSATNGTIGYWGTGLFDQSGGTASFSDNLILGHEPGSTGTYTLSGGSLSAARGTIGYHGVGLINQSGGSVGFGMRVEVGSSSTTMGTYQLSAGTLDASLCIVRHGLFSQTDGCVGMGMLNVVGGLWVDPNTGLIERFGGRFELSGGSIRGEARGLGAVWRTGSQPFGIPVGQRGSPIA